MKKIVLFAALALMGGILFAQAPGAGPGRGPGFGPDIEWKLGTVVTTEYKKVTGQIVIGQTLATMITFKADGVEYQLWLPRAEFASLKNGDTITIEGTFTTVKSDTKIAPSVRPFKVTVAGKEVDLSTLKEERPAKGDRSKTDRAKP